MSYIEMTTEEEIPGVKALGGYVALAPEGDNHGLVFVLLEDGSVRWHLAHAVTGHLGEDDNDE
jgi:hypothetical protein